MTETLELRDGQVIVEYDPSTGEILGVSDWHGNDLTCTRWDRIAQEEVAEIIGDRKERGE